MKVLLVKCHKRTLFSMFEPIVTEPLELEYISGLLQKLDIEHQIYDALLEGGSFAKRYKTYKPDVLLLSGYITAVDTIIRYSCYAKSINPEVKVIVGGVHAEINYEDFFAESIDFIVHSDGVNTLEALLNCNLKTELAETISGVAFRDGKRWKVNSKRDTCLANTQLPNRSYFEKSKTKTKYLGYQPIAIVRTALSCPHHCSFCYCKLLNSGKYEARDMESVIDEISTIDSEHIWIIDDSFLLDRNRISEFITSIKNRKIKKKFIAYSRVDFIAGNEDILAQLADVGLIELIVGIEAVDDHRLEELNKNCTANDNQRAAAILAKYKIRLTALFIVGADFTHKDFRNLSSYIKKVKPDCYALSIFTPLKGTEVYRQYQDQIRTKDYAKYDFLHLTIRPSHMPAWLFYLNFYLLYLGQFFRSRDERTIIYQTLRRVLTPGGANE